MKPQLRKILTHVRRVGHISSRDAIVDYRIMALPRRIADLRALGYQVRSELQKHPVTGQRYKRYYVEGLK